MSNRMCGLLEIGLRGVIFAHFVLRTAGKMHFSTAPWPAADILSRRSPHHLASAPGR